MHLRHSSQMGAYVGTQVPLGALLTILVPFLSQVPICQKGPINHIQVPREQAVFMHLKPFTMMMMMMRGLS